MNAITPDELKKFFPKATKSCAAVNQGTNEKKPANISKQTLAQKAAEQVPVVEPIKTNFMYAASSDEKKLNKTERQWFSKLSLFGYPCIQIQAITLKLADDTRYTPDFSCIGPNGEMIFWEVKGFMRDDALVKIKVAARLFRWAKFILVRKEKGLWKETEIKP